MNEISGSFDDVSGLEKMNYQKFSLAHTVRRPSQAPRKFDDWASLQLPNNSVLHTLNGFDTLVSPQYGLPDSNLPLVVNEKLPVWLKINTVMASETSLPFGVSDSFIYRPSAMSAQLSHFYQTHRQYHRILSDRTLNTMSNVLTWIDYSPLNEAKVTGTLHAYRKFDILFRTILDRVVSLGSEKHHYIVFPQSELVFSRSLLQRSYRELATTSLGSILHDPSIFPVIHVLGYIFGKNKSLEVVPYKEDIKILGKKYPLFESLHSTSLIERINPDLFESINFIFQKGNNAVIYNLADIAKFSEDENFYSKFYRHIMNLRLDGNEIPDHIDEDSPQFDTYIENITVSKGIDGEEINRQRIDPQGRLPDAVAQVVRSRSETLSTSQPASNSEDVEGSVTSPTTFEDRLRKAVVVRTAADIVVEPKKEMRRNTLLENHFKATMNGKPIGELIQTLESQQITPKTMSYINATPEESYQKSSLLAMDRAYHTHAYHHEMAKVVGSLAKHGMFINKVEESKTHTEMDRTTTYRLHLTDLSGKTHHVKFTLPDVDDEGLMKLSGIEYRLTRQIANVPICKVSPTRVNLSSYFNKINVERIQSKRYSYEHDTYKLIMSLRTSGLAKATLGSASLPTIPVAYDYTAVGRNFTEISFDSYVIYFGGDGAAINDSLKTSLNALQKRFGVYVGTGDNETRLFWNVDNQLSLVDGTSIIKSWKSFHHMLYDVLGKDAEPDRTPMEWTQASIINQKIPLVYILAYKFGLKTVLDMIRLDYRFYTNKRDIESGIDDLIVTLADGFLVFNRYPLSRSLIATGLLWTNLSSYTFNDLAVPDTYAKVFRQKGMSVGVLKGLNGFFDFFVDPITETVLEKMGEPITFHELLLRANVMLTDYQSIEASSVKLHRFRLYERFNGIVYNEIYRALANHRNNPSSKKSFSINPEAVFQKIVQDATVSPNEVINPVHEVKQRANFTFTGGGGRMGRSFTPKDIIYPQDGLGVISETVPDSGKVGITSYLSASPNIDDIHGIPKPYKDGDTLEPPQILSIGSMVMPGGTTDDGKRNNYLSIQISHYVPNHEDGETLAVRTGYDSVLPHLSSNVFAVSAEDNGVVESIDDKQRVLKVRYADQPILNARSLKLPYLDTVLDSYRHDQTSFGFLIPDTDVSNYPMGGIFSLTKTTCGKIVDRLRCEALEAIPDKDTARKQNTLIQDFTRGKYQALYFIRFTPMGNKIPGEVKSYSFTDLYSQNSGSYLLQKRTPHVKVGEAFKTGDILIYNPGFFVPDPMSKQVTFKHGVTATIALVERSSNHEDACEISRDLSNRLKMTPCHQKEVITNKDAAILGMVKVGDHVETSDSLCVISADHLIGSSLSVNVENLDIMEKLNRQTPSAGYTGIIRKIRVLYGCDRDQLSDSLKTILKVYEKEVRDNFKALSVSSNIKLPEKPGWVAPGTKYQGIDFTSDTVILEFMIEETLSVSEGDKIVLSNAAKSVVSYVSEEQHYTESGIPVDILFSTTSITNRIVASPLTVGMAERNMEELKKQVLSMYF